MSAVHFDQLIVNATVTRGIMSHNRHCKNMTQWNYPM